MAQYVSAFGDDGHREAAGVMDTEAVRAQDRALHAVVKT